MVLAPIVVNIVALHVFLAPAGLPIAAVVLAAELTLAWAYRASFAPMLQARPMTTNNIAPHKEAGAIRVAA